MKKMLKVTGLDCAHCAAEFEKIIKNADGIEDAKMNFILEKMIVTAKKMRKLLKTLSYLAKNPSPM